MITKKDLLKDIRKYSPEQIAEAVRSREISMYELAKGTEGAFTPLLKRHVKEILERPIQPEQREETKISSSDTNVENSADKESSESMELPPEIPFDDEPSIESLMSEVKDSSSPDNDTETPQSIDTEHTMFSHPFSFKGRIRRSEYWLTLLISSLFYFGVSLFTEAMTENASSILIFVLILMVPYLWFIWAQGAKRCHDRGNSGFFQLIPYYGLWMLFAEGDSKTNQYGNSPK